LAAGSKTGMALIFVMIAAILMRIGKSQAYSLRLSKLLRLNAKE
jgi:hypothetical protein